MTFPARLISVCICTFRRPEGLRRALASAFALQIPSGCSLELLVVDNDASGSAAAVVDSFRGMAADISLRLLHEPTPGVSHARNRCLESAAGEMLAFFDDDEFVDPDWLIALLACMDRTQADAVFGPVLPSFETAPSPWALASGVHDRQRFPSGTVLPWREARTGNVALRRSMLAGGHRFSTEFARTGGEDSLFFATAQSQGRKLVWCDEAIVHESVPAQRLERGWILHRAFMGGRTYVRLEARLGRRLPYTTFAVRGLVASVLSLAAVAALYLRGDARHVRHLCRLYGHLGKVAARFYSYGPYAGDS
jgi:succinoglycan biosynthesis protein ExoM